MLNNQDLGKICEDYGITATDLRIAGTVEMSLAGKLSQTTEDVQKVAEEFNALLGEQGIVNAIRWATWVKHARENMQETLTYPELLEVRKTNEKVK